MPRLSFGLRTRLLALVILAVLPAVGLTLYTSLHERGRASRSAESEALRVANLVTKDQADRVTTIRQELTALASLPFMSSPDVAQCNLFLAAAIPKGSNYNSISLLDAQGKVICSSQKASLGRDASASPWFSRLKDTREFTTGGYTFSATTSSPGFVSAFPIKGSSGEVSRVLVGVLGFSWMEGVFTAYKLPSGGTLTLVDATGRIMAHYPDNATWVGQTPDDDISKLVINESASGTVDSRGIDQVKRLYGFSPMPFSEPGREAYIFAGYPSSVAFGPENSILRYTLLGLAATAIFIGAIAWFGRDLFVLQHMKRLAATADLLEAGDLSARTGVPYSRDEVGQLAMNIDRMAAARQEARRQRDEFEASLAVSNEALERTNAVLKASAADLARKNEDLEAFTYSISHDLKEPLRAIEGFSQYLVANYSASIDARGQDLLGRMARASVRMKDLIDDLLAVSRAGRPAAEAQTSLDAHRVVDEVLESLSAVISDRSAKVVVHDLPPLVADRARFDQIVRNLISNAIKFNVSAQPEVEIGIAEATPESVTLYFRDNGIGMAPQYHGKIFGLFQRLHTRDEFQGNGAGLAIVKRATEALGGSIRLESAEGKGTTFFVTLPRRKATGEVTPAEAAA